jgi:hypothetical protein
MWLCDLFCKKPIPEKIQPTSTRVINYEGLYDTLKDKFPEAKIYLSDNMYLLCNTADISKFLQQDATNKYKYDSDTFDCDDFSYRLMGQFSIPNWSYLAFGIVWTNRHALNCCVDEDLNFWFVEPQSDTLQTDLKDWQGASIRFIIM